ncbi:hypothetical protein [Plesiomonas shigelloides]|uniref:hypothetical protein n=1 Tax=Plesiomonas shigelloides TaxID=703 RepID=UPI001262695C|nr:hypothetical protein [Plesiomonas shigelloides]KAB7699056.1 hypothetical protein GBN15_05545 [Plesiomonas shigelloides]
MDLDWKYWITTLVAVVAALIAWGQRKDARKMAAEALESHKRLEQYEHLPILIISVEADGEKIRISLTNTSPSHCVSSYEIKLYLRIQAANNSLRIDIDDHVVTGGFIAPNSTTHVYPDVINKLTSYAIPAFKDTPTEEDRVLLRAVAQFVPPHPKSEKIVKESTSVFMYQGDRFQPKKDSMKQKK